MARIDDEKEIMDFLKKGAWKGTKTIHDHLKDKGVKISRISLLKILHCHHEIEMGEFVSIGGIRQRSWIA